MSVIKITEEQKQRLLELYNTPTSELKSKDICPIVEEEMGFKIPYNLLGEFYQRAFNLDISKRKRKPEILQFEFEDGTTIQLDSKNSEEEKVEASPEKPETLDTWVRKEPVNF